MSPVSPLAPVPLVPVPPPPEEGPVGPVAPFNPPYGKSDHTRTPSPILKKRVSDSNPSSPMAKTGSVPNHSAAVPRRNWS
uniref:Uncharacterized protein n=1 Tax=viral metagenome TaxID=1070528 RepID=A0A6C0DN75_9ZZZZ